MSLKNPKKVHETEDFAIFKGKDGHELKILKKGLSEKLRKELSALPLHAAEGAYAESMQEPSDPFKMPQEEQIASYPGGATKPPAPATPSDASAPAQAIKQLSPSQEAYNKEIEATSRNKSAMFSDPESMPKEFDPYAMERAKSAMERSEKAKRAGEAEKQESAKKEQARREFFGMTPKTREGASQLGAAPQSRSVAPEAPSDPLEPQVTAPVEQKPQPQQQPARSVGQSVADETTAFANDVATGAIQPKTYSELFADKSTLGKIGSLFGMLLAGAGSGLTKQPNVLMEMMNKEIDRDLEAQKKNVENKRSYYQLNLEHQLRKVQMKKGEAEAGLTGEQAKLTAAEADMKRAQIQAWAETQIQPRVAAAHHLQAQVDKMPPGPQKVAGQQAVDQVNAGVAAFSQQVIQQAEQAHAIDLEAQFQQRQKRLMSSGMLGVPGGAAIAQDEASKHVPGFGDASIPVPGEVRKQLTGGLAFEKAARDYVDFAREHQANFAKYLQNPVKAAAIAKQGAVKAANLTAAYREATNGGVFKAGEQDFINKIIPEQPASWKAFFNQIPAVEESMKDMRMKMENTAGSVNLEAPVYYKGHYYQKGPNGQAIKVK